jgi:hypothetical protein
MNTNGSAARVAVVALPRMAASRRRKRGRIM